MRPATLARKHLRRIDSKAGRICGPVFAALRRGKPGFAVLCRDKCEDDGDLHACGERSGSDGGEESVGSVGEMSLIGSRDFWWIRESVGQACPIFTSRGPKNQGAADSDPPCP